MQKTSAAKQPSKRTPSTSVWFCLVPFRFGSSDPRHQKVRKAGNRWRQTSSASIVASAPLAKSSHVLPPVGRTVPGRFLPSWPLGGESLSGSVRHGAENNTLQSKALRLWRYPINHEADVARRPWLRARGIRCWTQILTGR
jgi:hypothetical protein